MTRLAIITGASRGLGLALAEQLRSAGWRVRGLSRQTVHPDDIAVDLANPEAIAPAVKTALADEPRARLDSLIVVHNAATVGPLGRTAGQSAADIAAAVHLNLTAGVLLFAAAAATCQDVPGRKVLAQITSGAAERPHAGLSVYCATKAGMEQHMRVLALEQAAQPHPFIVVSLDPGALDTGMQATLREADPSGGLAVEGFVQRQQQGRLSDPAAVARGLAARLVDPGLTGGQRYRVDPLPPL